MSLLRQSKAAIVALADLASGNPDPVSVLNVQADLIRLHVLLGEEMTAKFNAKERSYIARKLAQAKNFQHGRAELKMTVGDANEAALLAAGEDLNREVDSATEYELYRTLLKSLQNAIDFARSIVSFYKSSESHA